MPARRLSRARTSALAQIAEKCRAVTPADLNSPCVDGASAMAEVAACVLAQHATHVEQMVGAEYRDACGMLAAVALDGAYPSVCGGP